jgi:protein-L-isoaspartate(D-aspartate) O-methyltransferase
MRKVFLLVGLAGVLAVRTVFAGNAWDYQAFTDAMQKSGRDTGGMNEKIFAEAQVRKKDVLNWLEGILTRDFGKANPAVMNALAQVPREYFMYNYEKNEDFSDQAYLMPPKEWPVGYGSVLSDYIIQAYMTQMADPKPEEVSLEIGTGSGYQSAILSRIVKKAYTIEIITSLGEKVHRIYGPIGYENVHTRVGDGYFGWPEVKEGFDIILVTCSTPFVPPHLLEQLKEGGRMVRPIGQPYSKQFLYLFTKDGQGKVHSNKLRPVEFIPMTGEVMKQRQ